MKLILLITIVLALPAFFLRSSQSVLMSKLHRAFAQYENDLGAIDANLCSDLSKITHADVDRVSKAVSLKRIAVIRKEMLRHNFNLLDVHFREMDYLLRGESLDDARKMAATRMKHIEEDYRERMALIDDPTALSNHVSNVFGFRNRRVAQNTGPAPPFEAIDPFPSFNPLNAPPPPFQCNYR